MSATVLQFTQEPELSGSVHGDRPPLIEPGEYDLMFHKRWMGYLYGKRAAKLILVFRVATIGPAYGEKLFRCYNIKSFDKKRGTFRVGWNSNFVKDYARLFGQPTNLKSIGTNRLKGKIVQGKVRSVVKDFQNHPLPECLHYSVIDQLSNVIVGDIH